MTDRSDDVATAISLEDLVDETAPDADREAEANLQGLTEGGGSEGADDPAPDDCPFSAEQQVWLEERMREIATEVILEAAEDGTLDVDLALDIADSDVPIATDEADETGECPDCGEDLKRVGGRDEPVCIWCEEP